MCLKKILPIYRPKKQLYIKKNIYITMLEVADIYD